MALLNAEPQIGMTVGVIRFERRLDGSVTVLTPPSVENGPVGVHTMDDATWASVVCAVSDRGEGNYCWYQALAFHSREKTAMWLMAVGDPLRHFITHVADRLMFGLHRGTGDEIVRIDRDGHVERNREDHSNG